MPMRTEPEKSQLYYSVNSRIIIDFFKCKAKTVTTIHKKKKQVWRRRRRRRFASPLVVRLSGGERERAGGGHNRARWGDCKNFSIDEFLATSSSSSSSSSSTSCSLCSEAAVCVRVCAWMTSVLKKSRRKMALKKSFLEHSLLLKIDPRIINTNINT